MAKKAGRPKLEFDLEEVEKLAALQLTQEELAAVLKCSVDTITRRMKDDPDFADIIKRGQESGKASLKRMQWKAAQAGNVTMLIWLGKQLLGQSDRQDLQMSGSVQVILPEGMDNA